MKYIIRKFVEAATVQEAIRMDRKTPVHDCYLKEGEAPKEQDYVSAVGFRVYEDPAVPYEMRKRAKKR